MVRGIFARCVMLALCVSRALAQENVQPTEITDEREEIYSNQLTFSEGLYDMERSIGRSVTLSCSIEGTPPLNLFMYHDKIATFKQRNRRRLYDVDVIHDAANPGKLTIVHVINEVKPSQAGVYKCQGESVDGTVMVSSGELTLSDPCKDVACGFREQCLNHKGTGICTCDFECTEDKPVCAGEVTYGSMCHLERAECRMGKYVEDEILEGACADEVELTEAGCTMSGEGHVTKFNGDFFTFRGSCPYLMAKDTRRGVFVAYARTEACGADDAGVCLRSVTMYVDRIYGFSLERGWVINDNGRSRNVAAGDTISLGGGAVSVTRVGKTLVGTIKNKGIMFYYDGINYFKLSVPLDYVDSEKDFTGFCGPVPVDSMPSGGRDISEVGGVDMPSLGPNPAVCAPEFGAPECGDVSVASSGEEMFSNIAALAPCASAVPIALYAERAGKGLCTCANADLLADENYCFCNVLYSYVEECRQAGVKITDFGGEFCAKSFHKDVFKAEGITYNQFRRWKKN